MKAKKSRHLDWISVLNEQTEWQSERDAEKWLLSCAQTGGVESGPRNVSNKNAGVMIPTGKTVEFFCQILSQMRKCIYDLHFGMEPKIESLNTDLHWLKLSWQVHPKAGRWGSLIAEYKNPQNPIEAPFSYVIGTLLLEFCQDLSRCVEGDGGIFVHRCEGVFRAPGTDKLSLVMGVDDSIEQKWRQELSLFAEITLAQNSEIQRCADLFISNSRSKYCSDTCRFSTFQISKQVSEPNYLADKQRRYRSKKST